MDNCTALEAHHIGRARFYPHSSRTCMRNTPGPYSIISVYYRTFVELRWKKLSPQQVLGYTRGNLTAGKTKAISGRTQSLAGDSTGAKVLPLNGGKARRLTSRSKIVRRRLPYRKEEGGISNSAQNGLRTIHGDGKRPRRTSVRVKLGATLKDKAGSERMSA